MNTNLNNMLLEIFLDYCPEYTGQEWHLLYLIPALNYRGHSNSYGYYPLGNGFESAIYGHAFSAELLNDNVYYFDQIKYNLGIFTKYCGSAFVIDHDFGHLITIGCG